MNFRYSLKSLSMTSSVNSLPKRRTSSPMTICWKRYPCPALPPDPLLRLHPRSRPPSPLCWAPLAKLGPKPLEPPGPQVNVPGSRPSESVLKLKLKAPKTGSKGWTTDGHNTPMAPTEHCPSGLREEMKNLEDVWGRGGITQKMNLAIEGYAKERDEASE